VRLRRASAQRIAPLLWAVSGPTLLMIACSAAHDPSAPSSDADGGDEARGTLDSGVETETGPDGGGDAAERPAPPPYDFAVKCAGTPCVTQIAARGGAHACVVLQGGSVRCWGANLSGQLGTGGGDAGSMPALAGTPQQVVGISNATGVAATGTGLSGTTCVVSGQGEVSCFGADAWGQLGRSAAGSQEPHPEPERVDGIQARAVTLTNTFALAMGTDNRLWSWGANDTFQLARDMSGPDASPANGVAHADRIAIPVRSSAGTSQTGFVVSEDGRLLSWGGAVREQLGRPTSVTRDAIPRAIALSDVSSVTAGTAHACALRHGSVYCWGANGRGQLGTARKAEELFPVPVLLPPDVYAVAVVAGGDDTCALAADGTLYCWGANGRGQLGILSDLDQPTPRRIDGVGEGVVAVALMDESICALLRGGTVKCWGSNLLGQLGRGASDALKHVEPGPVRFE
jgi:alpha-tubulin suppressor-like RCC1 family protein